MASKNPEKNQNMDSENITLHAKEKELDQSLWNLKNELAWLKGKIEKQPINKKSKELIVQKNKPALISSEIQSSFFDEKISDKSLEDVISRVGTVEKQVKSERGLELSWKNEGEGMYSADKEHLYWGHLPQITSWLASSDRQSKKEIAQSATDLIYDIYTKDPNPLADSIRKVAQRFLS